jgi:hypothetical protein
MKHFAEPQRPKWLTDPETGAPKIDYASIDASIDGMRNTGRCFSCNHAEKSELRSWAPDLKLCWDYKACLQRGLDLIKVQEARKRRKHAA